MGDGSGSRPSSKGKGRPAQNNDVLAMDLDTAEGGTAAYGGAGAFSQMQLVEQQVWTSFSCGSYTNRLPGFIHPIQVNSN